MKAIEFEKEAFHWFKNNYDVNAELQGGNNCYVSDIFSPLYNCFIEVKYLDGNSARCGQFTTNSISNNPYSEKLLSCSSLENLKNFVKYHYNQKNVSYFIVKTCNGLWFGDLENFIEKFSFSLQKPYKKRNGTHTPSKKYFNKLEEYFGKIYNKEGHIFIQKNELKKTYHEIEGIPFFINENLEIRQQSKKYSETWHIEVKE